MISLIFSGYISSIGKVLKNSCRRIAFFWGPNIDHMKKYVNNIFQFGNEISNKFYQMPCLMCLFLIYCPYSETNVKFEGA